MAFVTIRYNNTVDWGKARSIVDGGVHNGVTAAVLQVEKLARDAAPVSGHHKEARASRGHINRAGIANGEPDFKHEKSLRNKSIGDDVFVVPMKPGRSRVGRGDTGRVIAILQDTNARSAGQTQALNQFEYRIKSGRRKGETVHLDSVYVAERSDPGRSRLKSSGVHQSGHLKRSITHSVTGSKGRVVGKVYTRVPYAYYIEKGFNHKGGGRVARPFLLPALHQIEDEFRSGKFFKG